MSMCVFEGELETATVGDFSDQVATSTSRLCCSNLANGYPLAGGFENVRVCDMNGWNRGMAETT